MRRAVHVLLMLAGVAWAAPVWAACLTAPQPQLRTAPLAIETLRGRHDFTVELAVTRQERTCGLMRRPRLARDAGMLFKQPSVGPAYFWMKNTPEPLDMLFLDSGGRVLHVAEHTIPYTTRAYGTEGPVAAVLELRAGTARRIAVEVGDRVLHAWFEQG